MSLQTALQASSSPIAPPTGRSLLSRLASPLRARTRNLADFHIRPHDPHRQYSPGDVVKGLVVLTVVKPIRITHLTVALHGFVRVFKAPNGAADGAGHESALSPGSNSKKSQYFGNGHASLFQDEVTLCGEGRLEVGVYEFEFELEFPDKPLPTSIDFERGSISYIIRSTITRPTTIAVTSSCDRKISLIETIDIGPMIPPKPRIISLEPISKRTKKSTKPILPKSKTDKDVVDLGNISDGPQPNNSPVPEESASQRGSADLGIMPRSPVTSDVQSETSAESVVSSSTGLSFRMGPVPSSFKPARGSQGGPSNNSIASKTITTTIELLKSGCLPGDSIAVRVSIKHTKRIKSTHGIIITLYRQGRIDSAPPLSLFSDIKGKAAERLKHDEYYPKSKTGLGGLSLTSAGSSSVFRKDLSQIFAPIIIDPLTMSTVVTASIRVPEDVFPTITSVPGQMISFRYHIEVVVDLGGKLAGQEKHAPRLGMVNVPSNFASNGNHMSGRDGQTGVLAAWGGSIVDTDHIRREKSVVACLFEIIVGTTDSALFRGRGNALSGTQFNDQTVVMPRSPTFSHNSAHEQETPPDHIVEEAPLELRYSYYDDSWHQSQAFQFQEEEYDYQDDEPSHDSLYRHQQHATAFVPPPEIPLEDGLTEKGRILRAEERLLPSRPPQEDGPSCPPMVMPSAPEDPNGNLYWHGEGSFEVSPTIMSPLSQPPSHIQTTSDLLTAPSAPSLEDLTPHATNSLNEDKQELERRRLMAEASSPSDFPDDQGNADEGTSGTRHEPTAPVLMEEDEYGGHYASNGRHQESLPRYER